MPFFQHGGLRFYYEERGNGIPVVFQHGLGGEWDSPSVSSSRLGVFAFWRWIAALMEKLTRSVTRTKSA
jgi:pimeloyl-ACP methyl ester carboxylesterase